VRTVGSKDGAVAVHAQPLIAGFSLDPLSPSLLLDRRRTTGWVRLSLCHSDLPPLPDDHPPTSMDW
jgi:hypothetical protein